MHQSTELTLSRHAYVRCSQRAISSGGIDLLLEYGASRPCGGGCESYFFDRRSWSSATQALGSQIACFERYRNLYVIVAADSMIVTVAWRQ